MLEVGDCLKAETKTTGDTFGTCFYEVLETGLPAPEKGRENETDGIKCVMLGGSGPAARKGLTLIDSQWKISLEIQQGIIEVLSKEVAIKALDEQPKTASSIENDTPRPATGVIEID